MNTAWYNKRTQHIYRPDRDPDTRPEKRQFNQLYLKSTCYNQNGQSFSLEHYYFISRIFCQNTETNFKQDPCVAACALHVTRPGKHTAGIILATLDEVHTLHRQPLRKYTQGGCDKSAKLNHSKQFQSDASLIKQSSHSFAAVANK